MGPNPMIYNLLEEGRHLGTDTERKTPCEDTDTQGEGHVVTEAGTG